MQIHWRHPHAVAVADQDHVNERIEALAQGRNDLIDVWIDVRPNEHHKHGGDEVSIRCQARAAELVATRTAAEPGLALWDALRAFEREVHRMRERRIDRRTERPAPPPYLGVIDRVFRDRDYGFVITEGGEQVYFHRNALRDGLVIDELEEGQNVGLDVELGLEGPQATVVMRPPPQPPPVP